MCGRYILTSPPETVRRIFEYPEQPNLPPRYNIAPTQPVAVVVFEHGRHFRLMRWGLLPAWVKDPTTFSLVINARAETVLEKPAFKNAMKRRRCLIPADGYYEWQAMGSRKQPFFIRPRNSEPMGLAALHETWLGPNGEELDTVAIVTTAAREEMLSLHARVPVVIQPDDYETWLDSNACDAEQALNLLKAPPENSLVWHPVSVEVNKVANDRPELIGPVDVIADEAQREAVSKPARRSREPDDENQGSLF
jgi:putative SOS response-associated peptidase YedK